MLYFGELYQKGCVTLLLSNIVCLLYVCVEWNERNNKVAIVMIYCVSIMCYLDMCVYCFTY
jgi:hypothetical protein